MAWSGRVIFSILCHPQKSLLNHWLNHCSSSWSDFDDFFVDWIKLKTLFEIKPNLQILFWMTFFLHSLIQIWGLKTANLKNIGNDESKSNARWDELNAKLLICCTCLCYGTKDKISYFALGSLHKLRLHLGVGRWSEKC